MSRGTTSVLVLAFAAIVACAPINPGPQPIAPVNACPDHPCTAYQRYQPDLVDAQCNAGACTVTARLDYILVVSVPETSFFAPNTTFAIPYAKLYSRSNVADCTPSGTLDTNLPCARLPDVVALSGQYIAFYSAQDDANYYLGNGVSSPAVLPSHVVYRPLWALGAQPATDATGQGLPLLSTLASVAFTEGGTAGPLGGPSVAFGANVSPGVYERTVQVDPPFDAAFPPDVSTVTVGEGKAMFEVDKLVDLDTIGLGGQTRGYPKFNLSRGTDGASMDGSVAFLRDQTTKRRVSSAVVLGLADPCSAAPCAYHVQLNTNHHPPPDVLRTPGGALFNTELVVAPGADGSTVTARPTFVVPFLAGELPPDEKYPDIPAPALVSGTVTSSIDQTPVAADLSIVSTQIFVTDANLKFSTNLEYATQLSTDDQGRYSLLLPRGDFRVVVTPHTPGLTKVIRPLTLDPALPTQAGKGFSVGPQVLVHGVAHVADGRPLAGADVDARPAAAGQSSGGLPNLEPRPATARTDDAGAFTLRVAAGTYDISVRPAAGSRLPWFVSTSRDFGAASSSGDAGAAPSDVVLEPFAIPAPVTAGNILKDPQLNPIVRAVVRAYALPVKGTAYVEIGQGMTDASGYYDLYLAGLPR